MTEQEFDDRGTGPLGDESGAAREWMLREREALRLQHREWRRAEGWWSLGRLITFILAVAAGVWLRGAPLVAVGGVALGLVLFGVAVWRHGVAGRRRAFGDRMLMVAGESLMRCGGKVELVRSLERPVDVEPSCDAGGSMLDVGETFRLTEQERDDLDLYAGPVGVFGLLNRTSSPAGGRRLRDWLENPCLSGDGLRVRQECVRWLVDHSSERLWIMAGAAALREEGFALDAFVQAVKQARPLPWRSSVMALQLWSVISAVVTVVTIGAAATGAYDSLWGLMFLLAFNGLVLMQIRGTLKETTEPWRDLRRVIDALTSATRQAGVDLPHDGVLAPVRDACHKAAGEHVLPRLRGRIGWADTGGIMHELCNHIFFYDLHVARAITGCVVPNRQVLLDGVRAVADLEAICSLACFAWEQPMKCWPVVVERPVIRMVDGVHPLLDPGECVANGISLRPDERMWVITGANMAGKSTFLRTVGVNVLLAQIGTVVTAGEMELSPHHLITDLRIRDDLSKHESYFLAEVRQLRRMVVPADGARIFGLVDEPFRGTNSLDRIAAGRAVLSSLAGSEQFFLVATHEQSLTELADGSVVKNYHFHEDLTEDRPVFDYRLHPGPAKSRTALRVLEMEGYPESVVKQAREWEAGKGD